VIKKAVAKISNRCTYTLSTLHIGKSFAWVSEYLVSFLYLSNPNIDGESISISISMSACLDCSCLVILFYYLQLLLQLWLCALEKLRRFPVFAIFSVLGVVHSYPQLKNSKLKMQLMVANNYQKISQFSKI
jgi:hypothetical protein